MELKNEIIYDNINIKMIVSKELIELYSIDYKDPTNFIYIANKVSIETIKMKCNEEKYDYNGILDLYYKFFRDEKIVCRSAGITSFPIYPHMRYCDLSYNNLELFPVQYNMVYCELNNNNLTTFPVQKNLEELHIRNNNLKSFPIQPRMQYFEGSNNKLTNFPVQPKMKYFTANNNLLTTFPCQPCMITMEANNNNIEQIDMQPEMKFCIVNNNYVTSFYKHPKLEHYESSNTISNVGNYYSIATEEMIQIPQGNSKNPFSLSISTRTVYDYESYTHPLIYIPPPPPNTPV